MVYMSMCASARSEWAVNDRSLGLASEDMEGLVVDLEARMCARMNEDTTDEKEYTRLQAVDSIELMVL